MNFSDAFNVEDTRYGFLTILLSFSVFILFLLVPETPFISILATLISAVFIIKFKNCIPLFLLFSFLTLYPLEAIKFFFQDIYLSAWESFQEKEIINKVLLLNTLFVLTLGNFIPVSISTNKFDLKQFSLKSKFLFVISMIIGVLIIIFGISGQSLLEGGQYGTAEKSSLHEYFILLFFILLIVAPENNLFYNTNIYLLFAFFSLKTLIYGGRIEVVQIFLVLTYVKLILPGKVNKAWIYLFVIFGYYFGEVVSNIRTNPMLFLNGNFIDILNPVSMFAGANQKYLSSNQGDVLQSSARIIGLIQEGFLGITQRSLSFISFVFSATIPPSLIQDYANLATYKQDIYRSGGGGLIAVYFYAWMGYAGPIFAGGFIGYFIKKAYTSDNIFLKLYGTTILFTFPRWFAYNPIFLSKFCFFSLIAYSLYLIFYKAILSKNDFR